MKLVALIALACVITNCNSPACDPDIDMCRAERVPDGEIQERTLGDSTFKDVRENKPSPFSTKKATRKNSQQGR